MKPSGILKSPLFWGSVAFVVLVVLPLYVALTVVVIRTKLFDLDGAAFTDEQYKAIWAFLGVALGTAATIMGAILTKSNNDKNLAQQHESERRQKLDTAVQALDLIKQDEGYAPRAVIAGALATLVHLGHPTIAMRATEVATRDRAIAVKTAVWLIDQVLRGEVEHSTRAATMMAKQEAVWLLYSVRSELMEELPGEFEFPSCAISAWPRDLFEDANYWLLDTMIGLLISRDPDWWQSTSGGATWTWVLYSIDELVQEASTTRGLRQAAATYGMRLLSVIGGNAVIGITDARDPAAVTQRLQPLAHQDGSYLSQWDDVCRWCDAAASRGLPDVSKSQ